MKQYPTISGHVVSSVDIYCQSKQDGSSLRTEWTPKTGFSKFGSRKVLMDAQHPFLGKGVGLFQEKYAKDLDALFRKERWEEVTCFFEFWGPKSFAGLHEQDDSHTVTLFDVNVYKCGLLPPNEFHKLFRGVDVVDVLYTGKANQDFIQSVKKGTLPGMPFEGVVCKGLPTKKGGLPTMFKVKNEAWVEKVKARYVNDPAALADLL